MTSPVLRPLAALAVFVGMLMVTYRVSVRPNFECAVDAVDFAFGVSIGALNLIAVGLSVLVVARPIKELQYRVDRQNELIELLKGAGP